MKTFFNRHHGIESKAKTVSYHCNKDRKDYSIVKEQLRKRQEQYDNHGARTQSKTDGSSISKQPAEYSRQADI